MSAEHNMTEALDHYLTAVRHGDAAGQLVAAMEVIAMTKIVFGPTRWRLMNRVAEGDAKAIAVYSMLIDDAKAEDAELDLVFNPGGES